MTPICLEAVPSQNSRFPVRISNCLFTSSLEINCFALEKYFCFAFVRLLRCFWVSLAQVTALSDSMLRTRSSSASWKHSNYRGSAAFGKIWRKPTVALNQTNEIMGQHHAQLRMFRGTLKSTKS